MKIIGITGGVGSGKSTVLCFLKNEYGAFICQADEVARQLQKKGQPCYEKIVAHYGGGILLEDGELNREMLAGIVFRDSKERKWLNQVVHPAVKEYILSSIRLEKEQGTKLFIIEAALLLEDQYGKICDELWYVYTEKELRKKRLRDSRGYSDEKIETIFMSQFSDEVFRRECDRVIDNSAAFEETCEQIRGIVACLQIDL